MRKRDKIGIMLALGFSKKEIAEKTERSVNTIDNQTTALYRETGSRNLADITRHMISRYAGVNAEEAFFRALHDVSVVAFVAAAIYGMSHQRALAELKAVISEFAAMLTSLIN